MSVINHNIKLIQSGNSEEEYGILIDQEIGRGNFAKVYKAVNMKNTEEKLAVKVLSLKDVKSKSMIEREFEIIKELPQHPNLIKTKPFKYFSENNFYILMDYCRLTLFEQIARTPTRRLTENRIVDLFYQLISGYKILYHAKILHQDIKPQNILIKDGVYKLADFGLSVFYETHTFQNKREGAVGYIAPEKMFVKNYKGNPKSDIYSMGVVLYEAIVGKHPYLAPDSWKPNHGIMEIMEELKEAKLKIPYNTISQYSLGFNQLFDKVLQMIEKSQNKRISFENLEEFVSKSPLFASCKKPGKRQCPFEQSKYPIHSNWTVKEVSQVLIVPFDASDDEEQKIIRKHQQSKSTKEKTQNQQSVEKLTNYILERRLVVYFLDRIARRLIVRKMKQVNTPIQSKAILHLIMFSKSVVSEMMSEIQAPKKFTFPEWKMFGNSENKSLIDLVLKDNRHLEDTVCDTFVEDKYVSKNDLKNANLLYRGGGKAKQIQFLQTVLQDTVRQISTFVDSSSSSAFVTLLLLLKAHEIIQHQQLSPSQIAEIQSFNRYLQDKSLGELMEETVIECQKRDILVSFDFSDQL